MNIYFTIYTKKSKGAERTSPCCVKRARCLCNDNSGNLSTENMFASSGISM